MDGTPRSNALPLLRRRTRWPTGGRVSPPKKSQRSQTPNPYIGFPYTKLMNSNAFIDQAAAVILTSVAKARELGIPRTKWVYLHGCADAYDHWYISDRINHYVTGHAHGRGRDPGDGRLLASTISARSISTAASPRPSKSAARKWGSPKMIRAA